MTSFKDFLDNLATPIPSSKKGEKVSPKILEQLFPIRNLREEIRQSFAEEHHSELIPAGTLLFSANSSADCAIYLLQGSVVISDVNGKSYEIDSGSSKAKFPICCGARHTTTAVAKTDLTILRVSINIMSTTNRFEHAALDISASQLDNQALMLFADHYQNHELIVPTLPEVAVRLRKAITKELGLVEVVKIITLDPVIAAKLIEVANCPLYVTQIPVRNCLDAVRRIGLNGTRSLVTALSLKQIFKSRSILVKGHLERLWKQSLYLSALCHVLASTSKQYSPEDALLAGLICDIGAIPFLSFVSDLPPEYIKDSEIDQALPLVIGRIGSTVLKEWQFASDFIDVAENSRNWYQNSTKELSLTDIVVLSRLHSLIGKKTAFDIPAITAIPAASKLKNVELSPENSLSILHDAKAEIHEALTLFLA